MKEVERFQSSSAYMACECYTEFGDLVDLVVGGESEGVDFGVLVGLVHRFGIQVKGGAYELLWEGSK